MPITIQKVTDHAKMVTDTVLLSHLAKSGIDKDYVEFVQDYAPFVKGVSSPYMKRYKDRLSGKNFAAFSQLPMVNHAGAKCEVGWTQNPDGSFDSKINTFQAHVKGNTVTITCINDQPDGRKAGQSLTYTPSLFFEGKEIKSKGKAILHPIDPSNENYQNNVLEWDYGICKRWLRLIEGKLLGTWIFAESPHGEVSIRYVQAGDFKLHLGSYAINDSEELIKVEDFDNALRYPFIVSDSSTFYPDAHAESTSVDGDCKHVNTAGLTWAEIIAGAGTGFADSGAFGDGIVFRSDGITNKYDWMVRAFTLFDTSALADTITKTGATLSVYCAGKGDPNSVLPNMNVYGSLPASNTALAAGDFDGWDSPLVAFATAKAYAAIPTNAYTDFALNAAGIAHISLTSISKFGLRNANYDVAATAPTWGADERTTYLNLYYAEQGNGYKPKLVVEYTVGWTHIAKVNGVAASAIAKVNGVAVAAIAKFNGVAV